MQNGARKVWRIYLKQKVFCERALKDLKKVLYSHRHFCFDKADFSTKRLNFTMPFNYVKVPKSKNELSHVHVGQKRPYTQKIRSLGQKQAILVFWGFQKR